ncbi:UNVERIFIED_CONTAM: hypothetical protein FKN15_050674 [Acipenser sinensis]
MCNTSGKYWGSSGYLASNDGLSLSAAPPSHGGPVGKVTRPIVPEDNTDLNGSTADPQAPYQPQGSLVHGEPWIALPT